MVKLVAIFAFIAKAVAQNNLTLGTSGTVYLIRHGEKDSKGCESDEGLKRADNMYDVFKNKFDVPKYVYAYKYGDNKCERCEQTVQPIAKKIGMSGPDMTYGAKDCEEKWGSCTKITDAIKHKLSDHDVVLMASQHGHIQYIAYDLGVPKDKLPKWEESDYDSVFKIKLSGSDVTFSVGKQGVNPTPAPGPPSSDRRRSSDGRRRSSDGRRRSSDDRRRSSDRRRRHSLEEYGSDGHDEFDDDKVVLEEFDDHVDDLDDSDKVVLGEFDDHEDDVDDSDEDDLEDDDEGLDDSGLTVV